MPLVFDAAPNVFPAVVPPPKMLVVGCEVDAVGREKGEEVAGVELAPNMPVVGVFDEDDPNVLDGPPLPAPVPKVNDMIWVRRMVGFEERCRAVAPNGQTS